MSRAWFYPYRIAPNALQLNLHTPDVDLSRASDGSLQVYDQDLQELGLRASVVVANDAWNRVFDPLEHDNPPAQVWLSCRSVESRKRQAWPLSGDGVYEHHITLSRSDWVGEVKFQAVLVRKSGNPEVAAEFGAERGSVLAWSEEQRVLFDEPPLPPGRFLEVAWKPFEEGEDWLRRHASHLFAVDTPGQLPVILLNSNFPNAHTVLTSKGTHGASARIRDDTFFMIAHQVWSSLLANVIDHLVGTMASPEDYPDPQELEPWEQSALKDWSEFLLPEETKDEAYNGLVDRVIQQDFRDDLLVRRLPTAIQQRLKSMRGFQGLVDEMAR